MTGQTQTRGTACDAAPPSAEAAPIRFACERPQDKATVDALIDRAFGPGRFAKTAERLREGGCARPEMSVCAWIGERPVSERLVGERRAGEWLAGAVRLWPATIGGHPAAFLGPIAVEQALRRHGLGAELVEQACGRARVAGERVVILVGDMGFFGPLGFEPVPDGRVTPPGPVDPRRLLWTALSPDGLDEMSGPLRVTPTA